MSYTLKNADRVLIIAEIGSNHNGDLNTALRLIDVAVECGADICKFQSFLVDALLAASDPNSESLRRLQVPREWYPVLMAHCQKKGVRFLSTATNGTTLDWMEEYGAWAYKVASCNITHRPLLQRLIAIGKPVIVSTGLATLDEIGALARHFLNSGLSEFAFLHCVSKYPAQPEDMRLRNITLLRELLPCPVGFSDHSSGTHMAVAAVALGARIVEKHISLDKAGIGMDHEVAILPDEFAAMCRAIRDTEKALFADVTPDRQGMFSMRRSLHFARDMAAGEILHADAVKIVRPEDGLSPDQLEYVTGRRLRISVAANSPITAEVLDNA